VTCEGRPTKVEGNPDIVVRMHHTAAFAAGSRGMSFPLGSLNTAVLLTSSLAMALARSAPTSAIVSARRIVFFSPPLRGRLPEPSATILAGELWGERASLPPELRAGIGAPDVEKYLNDLNSKLLERLQAGGEVYLSNAVIGGSFALRACVVNFRTTMADAKTLIDAAVREGWALHRR